MKTKELSPEIKENLKTIGMDIYRAQKLAQDHGFDSCTMTVIGPKAIMYGKWIDAYFGFFKPDNLDGFITTEQMDKMGCRCLALFGPDGESITE
jgi:hypothetical protein